jgi:cyclic pyranopterin phosphate synthase
MVDVSEKVDTKREATAKGEIVMQPETFAAIKHGAIAKGDVLSVAQVAGTMAAKKTWDLIPPLLLTGVSMQFTMNEVESVVGISATVRTTGKTGVEMEALTAASVAALTIYDMCKAIDRGMIIRNIRLARKSGGKSGDIILEDSE